MIWWNHFKSVHKQTNGALTSPALPSMAASFCLKLKIMSPHLPPAFDEVRSVAWGTSCVTEIPDTQVGPEGCWQSPRRDPKGGWADPAQGHGLLTQLHSLEDLYILSPRAGISPGAGVVLFQ